jgi:hypothetical protein
MLLARGYAQPVVDVPEGTKRHLRQEAGFGCCICGMPIIQYHHIVPLAVEDHNRPQDMMVLCPNHHDAVTKGAITEPDQRAHKANPFNVARGYVDGLLKVNQTYCAIDTGSCQFVGDGMTVAVDGEPLLALSIVEDTLALTLRLYDEQDNLLALIEENEWISGDPAVWDMEADYQRLLIRRKPGDVRLRLNASREPMLIRASLRKAGQVIDLTPQEIRINGVIKNFVVMDSCLVAMFVWIDTAKGTAQLVPDPKYGQGVLVPGPDPITRIVRGVNALGELRRGIESKSPD